MPSANGASHWLRYMALTAVLGVVVGVSGIYLVLIYGGDTLVSL